MATDRDAAAHPDAGVADAGGIPTGTTHRAGDLVAVHRGRGAAVALTRCSHPAFGGADSLLAEGEPAVAAVAGGVSRRIKAAGGIAVSRRGVDASEREGLDGGGVSGFGERRVGTGVGAGQCHAGRVAARFGDAGGNADCHAARAQTGGGRFRQYGGRHRARSAGVDQRPDDARRLGHGALESVLFPVQR